MNEATKSSAVPTECLVGLSCLYLLRRLRVCVFVLQKQLSNLCNRPYCQYRDWLLFLIEIFTRLYSEINVKMYLAHEFLFRNLGKSMGLITGPTHILIPNPPPPPLNLNQMRNKFLSICGHIPISAKELEMQPFPQNPLPAPHRTTRL